MDDLGQYAANRLIQYHDIHVLLLHRATAAVGPSPTRVYRDRSGTTCLTKRCVGADPCRMKAKQRNRQGKKSRKEPSTGRRYEGKDPVPQVIEIDEATMALWATRLLELGAVLDRLDPDNKIRGSGIVPSEVRPAPDAVEVKPRKLREFPKFMRNPKDRIKANSQFTPSVEGFVFDGAGGGQVAYWTCKEDRVSKEHTHAFDEYITVVQGQYKARMRGQIIVLNPGDELLIPAGTLQSGECIAWTRTIHAFGGRRAERET